MQKRQPKGIRRRSAKQYFGLPLVDIALGPDPDRGEVRGHARGIVAIGDVANGLIAVGGVACGWYRGQQGRTTEPVERQEGEQGGRGPP